MAPENDLQKVIYLPRFTVFEKHIRQRMQTIEQSTNQPTNRHICKQLTLEYGRPLKHVL